MFSNATWICCAQHFWYCLSFALMSCLFSLVSKTVYGPYNVYKFRTKYLVSSFKMESSTFFLVLIFNLTCSRHHQLSHLSFKWYFLLPTPLVGHCQVWELKWTVNIISSMGALWFHIVSPASRNVPSRYYKNFLNQ